MLVTARLGACLSVLLVLLALPAVAWGLAGELDRPSLATSKEFPDADYQKVRAVLEGKNGKFLGGRFVNSFTSLEYAGDTTALNQFIEALARCPNVKVRVSFYGPTGEVAECDWMVTHMAISNELQVRINLASKNVELEKLYLPPVKEEEQGMGG